MDAFIITILKYNSNHFINIVLLPRRVVYGILSINKHLKLIWDKSMTYIKLILKTFYFFIFLILTFNPVHANECNNPSNMSQIRYCMKMESLNKVTSNFNELLAEIDKLKNDEIKSKITTELKKSQDYWLKYRASECRYAYYFNSIEQNSGYSSDAETICTQKLDEKRVKTLMEYLKRLGANRR